MSKVRHLSFSLGYACWPRGYRIHKCSLTMNYLTCSGLSSPLIPTSSLCFHCSNSPTFSSVSLWPHLPRPIQFFVPNFPLLTLSPILIVSTWYVYHSLPLSLSSPQSYLRFCSLRLHLLDTKSLVQHGCFFFDECGLQKGHRLPHAGRQ